MAVTCTSKTHGNKTLKVEIEISKPYLNKYEANVATLCAIKATALSVSVPVSKVRRESMMRRDMSSFEKKKLIPSSKNGLSHRTLNDRENAMNGSFITIIDALYYDL